jgi:hypothetical protein
MLEPYHVKKFAELLDEVIKKYEKEFGKIEKPKAIEIAEKRSKKMDKAEVEGSAPSYLG